MGSFLAVQTSMTNVSKFPIKQSVFYTIPRKGIALFFAVDINNILVYYKLISKPFFDRLTPIIERFYAFKQYSSPL
jgi:hypothetical protein